MNRRQPTATRLTVPLRAVAQRLTFLVLLAAAVGVLLVGKADPAVFERARMAVTDVVAPILDALSRPAATAARVVDEGRHLLHLRSENAMLREENARLVQWETAARNLAAENERLRGLLGFVPDRPVSHVTARVIADSGGAFVRSLLINAGDRDGVRRGQAALAEEGLVGRVAKVGWRSSRVLLIGDLNSRIPVVVGTGRERAILAGDNTDLPRLIYLANNAEVAIGDRIVTSGLGGVFPPGLPIGTVESVSDVGVRVRPFVPVDRLEYLRVMDFDLGGMLDVDKEVAGRTR